MSSLPSNDFLDPILKKEDLIESFKVMLFIIRNFLWVLRSVVGTRMFHKILINEFEKCILCFMESLIADFVQYFSVIAKFLFMQGRLGNRLCVSSISRFC